MNAAREVDLLVAGAGPAGLTAALVASLEGLDVLLVEKSDQVGGTGATSAGTLWIPGNSQSKAIGLNDSAAAADRYLSALIGEGTNRALRAAYLATGPEAIDYLTAKTDVQFLPCGTHPDYRSNMPGAAVAGRAIVPAPFDGRLLGKDFKRLRAPIPEFMLLGGMMVGKADLAPLIGRFRSLGNFFYAAKLFARYFADRLRYPRGTRVMMGNALVGRLYYSLRKRNVPILFDAAIVELIETGEGVAGARLKCAGKDMVVKARKGVVLATGGYGHNARLRAAFMPQPVPAHSMSFAGNSGDGVVLGEKRGAALTPENGTSGLWTPASLTPRADGSHGLFPHFMLDRAKPGLIAVNAAGRRFVNEACSYHDFVLAMFESNAQAPTIPAWLICDARFIAQYGLGIVYPGHRDPGKFERTAISKAAARSMNWPARSASTPGNSPPPWRATMALPRPGSTSISARARPSSTASTATPPISRTPASARSPRRPSTRWRCGRPTSRSRPVLPPTPTRACSTKTAGRSPASMPAATTWPPSWAAAIPAPAPRSGRRWYSPIAR